MTATPVHMDMQVHSTFSDGADTVQANVAAAEAAGLTEMTCVDHVRVDTDWLAQYVAEVERMRARTHVRLTCGIEVVYAADHQVAMDDGVNHPDDVRARLQRGELAGAEVFRCLIESTRRTLDRPQPVVIAHLFSIVPKLGLDESDAPLDQLEALAEETARTGQRIEVNERYRTPSARTLRPFVDRGVPLLVSTDSHRADAIGRYDHCLAVLRELDVVPAYAE
jgi:putative hydrolase